MCFALQDVTTRWLQLEKGITMGHFSNPVCSGLWSNPHRSKTNGWRDQTTIWTKATSIEELYERRHQPPSNSSMYIQTVENDGWVDVVGKNEDQTLQIMEPVSQEKSEKRPHHFCRRGEKILLLSEPPIKSLGRRYTAGPSDKQMRRILMKAWQGSTKANSRSTRFGATSSRCTREWCGHLKWARSPHPLQVRWMEKPTYSSESGWGSHGAFRKWASLGRTPCSCHCSWSVWATCRRRTGWFLS